MDDEPRKVKLDDDEPAAPRASRASPKPKVGDPDYVSPADRKLVGALATMYSSVGMGFVAIGLQTGDNGIAGVGVKINDLAEPTAHAWLALANENPKLKATLRRVVETSKTGTLIGCHAAMFIPLLADRGIIPPVAAEAADSMFQTTANGNVPDV